MCVRIDFAELATSGVVCGIVTADQVVDAGLAVAGEVASKNPTATRLATRRLSHLETTGLSLLEGYHCGQWLTEELAHRPVAQQSGAAFPSRGTSASI